MDRYNPFKEMDRMFEQFRTQVQNAEKSLEADFGMPARNSEMSARNSEMPARNPEMPTRNSEMPARNLGLSARKGDGVRMDLKKRDEEFVFVADLPGFESEQIDLTFADGMLTLVAETQTSDEQTASEPGEIAARSEFTRSRRVAERMTIPEAIAEEDISASYRNGVLEVHLPLAEPEERVDDTKIDIID